MINNIVSRIFSAGILAIIYGCITHIMDVNTGQMGREAYLAKQAARYDRYLAHPYSTVFYVIACLIFVGICLAAYELIAFVVLKILERINADPI
jgi:uncharacterized membrane protein YwzB